MMEHYTNEYIDFRKGDCQELIKTLPDASVNIILTDPPYLYLKRQKLEREFDEKALFSEWRRVLKPGGFIVMFGRGTSFYRWNYFLSELEFDFKEEIVWDKSQCSSPLMALSRVHETVSIHVKGKGSINKVKVPYLEMKGNDITGIIQDIKRMKSVLNNTNSLDAVLQYLENKSLDISIERSNKHQVQVEDHIKNYDRSAAVINSFENGMVEKSIIYTGNSKKNNFNSTVQPCDLKSEDRSAAVVRIIDEGMNEKSIIHHEISDAFLAFLQTYYYQIVQICEDHGYDAILKEIRDHYSSIHPTQKPVALLRRLLALVKKSNDDVVLDCFGGSGSTGEACIEEKLKCILFEIDDEYYEKSVDRLDRVFRNMDRQISMF